MAEAILTKQNGVVTMDKSFDYLCSTLPNGTYTVSVKRKVKPRTLSQNALMWLWFACIERETGTDKLDVHDYYCKKFLRRRIYMNGLEDVVVGNTSKLNTLQMNFFWIRYRLMLPPNLESIFHYQPISTTTILLMNTCIGKY